MKTSITSLWFDRHSHPSFYVSLQGCPSLSGFDRAGALALLQSLPGDRLHTVLDWHSGKLPFSEADLERLPPAILVNLSLHGFALTGPARTLLAPRDPELVERNSDRSWCERNLPRLLATYAAAAGLSEAKLDTFMLDLRAKGIEAVEDLLLSGEDAWRTMSASRWANRLRFWATPETFRDLTPAARSAVQGLKLFLDGALGVRTAAISGRYHGGDSGLLLHTDAELRERLATLHPRGKPLAIHAIGDRAIEQGLAALEELERAGNRFPSVRLEHVQFMTEDQGRRARALGLMLSMQPNFNSDSVDYADRLEQRWLEINNPFRMLIDRCGFQPGRDLIFGSDGMPHGVDYALQWSLFPPYPGQRLTVDELLAGYGADVVSDGPVQLSIDDTRRSVTVNVR